MSRSARFSLEVLTAVLAGLMFGVPAVTAAWEILAHGDFSGLAVDSRRWGLLVAGLRIALASAVLAQLLGAGLTLGALCGNAWIRRLTWCAGGVVLLTPPYVTAYGLSLPILPDGLVNAGALQAPWTGWIATEGRAVACLGIWCAPIAATLLAAGWRATGRPAVQLALPDAGPAKALFRAGLPAMTVWIALSLTVCTVLTTTEYSVCHLCLVQVWNTEILALTQNLTRSGQALLLGWPILVLQLLAVGVWVPYRARVRAALTQLSGMRAAADEAGSAVPAPGWPTYFGVAVTSVALLLPWLLIARAVGEPRAFLDTWIVFQAAWGDGLTIAGASLVACIALAVGVDFWLHAGGWRRRIASAVFVLSGLFAFAPPVVIGDAFAAAYAARPLIADTVAIVVLTAGARYAFVAIGVVVIASRLVERDALAAAALDRADAWAAYRFIRLPAVMRAAGAAGGAIAVLCMTEVAATQMVTPPGVQNLALTLLNMIHFGRNDEVAATMVYLLGVIVLVMIPTVRLMRRGRNRADRISG